jgi:hypothetical protein
MPGSASSPRSRPWPASLVGELTPIDVRDPGEIERAIGAFARERNGGLIVTGSQSQLTLRNLIISLATRYRLPNVRRTDTMPRLGDSPPMGLIRSTRQAGGRLRRSHPQGEKPRRPAGAGADQVRIGD